MIKNLQIFVQVLLYTLEIIFFYLSTLCLLFDDLPKSVLSISFFSSCCPIPTNFVCSYITSKKIKLEISTTSQIAEAPDSLPQGQTFNERRSLSIENSLLSLKGEYVIGMES